MIYSDHCREFNPSSHWKVPVRLADRRRNKCIIDHSDSRLKEVAEAEAAEVVPAEMKKKGGHMKKQEAGARMAAAHHERMENFTLPTGACQPYEGDDEHCMDCFQMAMCQHPYCGTCGFCKSASADFDPERELLDYQCMCIQCARAMNRCCACGKAFNGKPIEVTLPLQHGPGNDEAHGVLLPNEDGEIEENWSKRMAAALEVARKYSGFSKFHDTYPPLFEELWDKYDAEHSGYIKAADAEAFAKDMVASGWKDWAPSERDCSLWKQIEEEFGGISLEQFAEMSENGDFAV